MGDSENAKPMREELERRGRLLEAINGVFRTTIRCESEEELARTCLSVAEELTGSAFGFIGVINQAGRLDTVAVSDPGWSACGVPHVEALGLLHNMVLRGIWSVVVRIGESLRTNDPASHPERVGTPEGHPPLTSFLGVPLRQGEKTIGMIALANKDGGYDQHDQEDMEQLSVVVAEAMLRKRAEEQLQEAHDELEARVSERTEELRAAELKVSTFLDGTDDLMTVVDATGRLTYVNQAGLRIFGYPPEALIGRIAFDFIHEDDRAATQAAFEGWLRDKVESASFENRQVSADGSVRTLLWTIMLRYDEPESFWSIARDITDRKRSEEELRLKKIVFEASIAANSISDVNGVITHVNPAFLRDWGHPSKEAAIGGSVGDFFANPDDAAPVLGALGEIGVWEGDFRAKRPDGSTFISHGLATVIKDDQGELIGYQSANLDVTSQRETEARLQETLEELARSNRELEQFAYVSSHDLQEPLRMVASYLQLLQKRYAGSLDKDADEFIAYAVDGATRMKQLINDLLIFSRVNTRGKAFESTESGKTLDDAMDNVSFLIEDTNADVVIDGVLPSVLADHTQLVQLFQNLLGNAIKFVGEGVTPSVHISSASQDDKFRFEVQDNGIGIDREYMDRIFVIFQRLHGREEYSGTGIGLAVCKRIVERHGGRIWVESTPGKGSSFFFTIPAADPKLEG